MTENAKYKEIHEALKSEILDGKYDIDHAFPSSTALARRFSTTRFTIRQALDLLARDGFIFCRRGKGTFVRGRGKWRSNRIGLIVHGNNYCEVFPPMCKELSRLVQERRGGALLLGDISSVDPDERAARAEALAKSFISQGVDGVIFQPIEFVADAEEENERILSVFRAAGVPVVLLDYDCVLPPGRSGYDVIGVNDFAAGRMLGLHLAERGAKRVSFLSQHHRAACICNRRSGVELACVEKGMAFRRLYALPDEPRAIRRFLATFHPDAFVCYNDTEAVILLRTLEKLGVSVPRDVMLAGCDDVFHAAYASVPFTTIHKPVTAIAEGVLHRLYSRIENPSLPPIEICFDAPLVVRASTAPRPSPSGNGLPRRRKQEAK